MPSPRADWPAGVARVVLDTVDSTSLEAARRAPLQPTWIMASRQSAARGRRGRAWDSPAGNFAASLAMRPGDGPAAMARRSFVAALALHDALTGLGAADLSLKWPNDVLLRDRKLAGILLESPAPGLLILGIGLNLAHVPAAATLEPGAVSPIALREVGVTVAPEEFLDALAPAYAAREAQFRQAFAATRADWLARAARLGQTVTARLPGEAVTGRFEDVDAEGCLILATPDGRRRIAAADIFFGEVPCS